MKAKLLAFLASAAVLLPLHAQETTRTVHLLQDDAQVKTTTKIYTLKHIKASDIMIFVNTAAHRYWANSQVRALNFSAAKKQALIVTTGDKFIPYIDQIVSVLDRPCKKNEYGSSVYNLGYKWKVYYPLYRNVKDLTLYAEVMLSGNGSVYAENSTIWLKDDMDDVDYALDWIKYFDRPVPQANVTFRYYSVRESTLRDIGIDYLAWKNGPGLNLFDFAFNSGRIAWDKVFNAATNLASSASWAYGGCFTAPAFDMSFVRLLQQSGEAKAIAKASINVINDQEIASLALTPTYNAITKDSSTHAASVIPAGMTDIAINVYKPTICFHADKKEINDMGWIPSDKKFYDKNRGTFIFAYDLKSADEVEANNYGTQIGSTSYTDCTFKTIDLGREQLLASASREYDVEQTTGVPFLCQLPVLKYIFGTTTTMKEKVHVFVTVEANLVHPESVVSRVLPDAQTPGKVQKKAAAVKTPAKTEAKK